MSPQITTVQTAPIAGQKPGTSGLRTKTPGVTGRHPDRSGWPPRLRRGRANGR